MRLFRILLFLYPSGFRRRYQDELCAAFEAMRSESRYGGLRGRVRLWRHVLDDAGRTASR